MTEQPPALPGDLLITPEDALLTIDFREVAYFECKEGGSNKFWSIEVVNGRDGFDVRTRYGRIGSSSRSTVHHFGDKYAADLFRNKKVQEKIRKGYRVANEVDGKRKEKFFCVDFKSSKSQSIVTYDEHFIREKINDKKWILQKAKN